MDIRSIRYFMEAARELNITRAAENLHIAQPPLSRQIHQLEEELGVELFERKKKKLQLTEVGQLLLHRGDQIVTLVEKTEDEIRVFPVPTDLGVWTRELAEHARGILLGARVSLEYRGPKVLMATVDQG